MNETIIERYTKEVKSESLGCTIIDPYIILNTNDAILELGSGNGNFAARLSDTYDSSIRITGVDLTPAMVLKANMVNKRDNISYMCSDIVHIPLADSGFNVIVSNCVINHIADKEAVYREIYRLLKNDGYFLVGDIVSVGWLPDEVRNDPSAIADCYGGAIPEDIYLESIKKAGFNTIEIISRRQYEKNGFPIESLLIKGVKK
ncbi:MAG: hypothetical protein A2015_02305 [Spirochaetes bacterium GWF1_31_7]|nr:MAG: hypothetical protein A2Y30_06155 [Spirochaetes bacterium GWE1_32_154]OHD50747.1 MAG: hypothetical protein A2015_02305 [Spirochaetes bacterium GWF1_31_7]OHD74190.1 MAG: hypothetical protein A2355_05670 [Spirochaetes bacterium RIFOXYB1_FULL_32_8]